MDVDSPVYECIARGEDTVMPTHTNGYPWFLNVIYSVFGYTRALVVFLQVLLGLCCGFLIYALAQRLFGQGVGLLSFAFFSVNLGFLVFPERLCLFMQTSKTSAIIASGILFGISIIVKPVALYFIFFLLLALVLFWPSKKLRRGAGLGLFIVCFYLPVVGYMTSNKVVYGRFCVSKLEQANLFVWFHAKIKATQRGTTHHEEMSRFHNVSSDELKQQFFTLIKQEPLLAIQVWAREVMKTFFGLYTSNLKVLFTPSLMGGGVSFFSSDNIRGMFDRLCSYISSGSTSPLVVVIGWAELVWNILRYLLVMLGILFLLFGVGIRDRKYQFFLFFALSYIFYFAMITGHDGCGRYRLMFEFLLIIVSSYAIWQLLCALLSFISPKNGIFCKNMPSNLLF
jgi:4-amino-4-deoxy-L-arabinose transferase-like glycosyltransferase